MQKALLLLTVTGLSGAAADYDAVRRMYGRTDYRAAIRALEGRELDGPGWLLLGQSRYMLAEYKKASEAMEKAVAAEPANSVYWNWLGRAFGRRAETSSPFTAPVYASKTRQAFEKAVELDGGNKEALSDLFEYYLEAPGFFGGGVDKATAVAARIGKLDPVEGHYVQFRLAEKRNDVRAAEQQLRRAVQLAPRQVGRLIDLARFLGKQGRIPESEQTFDQARKVAPRAPRILYEQAVVYIRAGESLDKARELLKQYLAAQLSPDDPPRREAEKLLRKAGA
jgi:cytochrome c-type biogenesis protein CcmH/NrfG